MEYPFDIHKVKQGDRTAFRDFFACMYPKLMALACRFVDENTATDMVQDVFASYWERKHLIEAHNIQSFLFKWLQNNCLNYLKHQTVVEAYETRVQLAEARAAAWDHASQANDPLHLLMGKNLLELVDEWIGKLPAKCAEAFRLCYFKDMTHKEIAEALHVSPRTVEGYIRNAIAFLRGKLGGGVIINDLRIVRFSFRNLRHLFRMRRKSFTAFCKSFTEHRKSFAEHRKGFTEHRKSFTEHRKGFTEHRKSFTEHRKGFAEHRKSFTAYRKSFPTCRKKNPERRILSLSFRKGYKKEKNNYALLLSA